MYIIEEKNINTIVCVCIEKTGRKREREKKSRLRDYSNAVHRVHSVDTSLVVSVMPRMLLFLDGRHNDQRVHNTPRTHKTTDSKSERFWHLLLLLLLNGPILVYSIIFFVFQETGKKKKRVFRTAA